MESIILLIVGFSLIILIHEGGHFLAAKYVGIRVEQFALGFGQALFSWRKGLGFRAGSSEKEYSARIAERAASYARAENTAEGKTEPSPMVDYQSNPASPAQLKRAADELGMGETEYRFNWVPLGGYVKMMGQDDTKPGIIVNDPRSYTSKTVGQRMLVISAGVIMNIIFAAIAFMVLFVVGMDVPKAVVGGVIPMAPAQMATRADGTPAPLQVGDQIVAINDTPLHNDFRKIILNTALAKRGVSLKIDVKRVNGTTETVYITPEASGGSMSILRLGVEMPALLEGPDLPSRAAREEFEAIPAARRPLGPGDVVVAISGEKVEKTQFYKLDQALQVTNGKPVELTVSNAQGKERVVSVEPQLDVPFGDAQMQFAGMVPRAMVQALTKPSSVEGKLEPGDVVMSISVAGDVKNDPSPKMFTDLGHKAGEQGEKLTITVLREGKELKFADLLPSVRLDTRGTKGLGIGVGYERDHAVVAEVIKDSPAEAIPAGSTISAINGVGVKSWDDVLRELRKVPSGEIAQVSVTAPSASAITVYPIRLEKHEALVLANMRYSTDILLKIATARRTTKNPLEAAWWGVLETRDSILQVYLTLSRLIEGSVPVSGVVGPVGMFQMGTKVASQGLDYLLWFLAIISANLAVVNFLPIPVVDGGHFLFLAIEKLRGKPVPDRIIAVATWCGLALIGFVFIAVTYQDILRMLTVH